MKTRIHPLWLIVAFVFSFALMRQCEGEPKVITKTETITKIVKEPITKVVTKEVEKPVYIEKIKTIKGKDSIIYKDKPSESGNTIEAKQYETELRSNNATANLTITANELYDVKGTITYPEKETTVETTITRDASGFYIYAQMPISSQLTTPEIGAMIQIKNKLIIGVGGRYDNVINNGYLVGTIAVKL